MPLFVTDEGKEKLTCREFMYNWLCGVAKHSAVNEEQDEKARKWEDFISDLGQSRIAKVYFISTAGTQLMIARIWI